MIGEGGKMSEKEIFEIALQESSELSITIDLKIIFVLLIVLFIAIVLMKFIAKKASQSSILIEQVELGIGDSKVTLKYDKSEKKIAYNLWVEMNTRKIGLKFDEENDVISEVYDSWYHSFDVIRQLLKEIPVYKIKGYPELIRLTVRVLNLGLRPHLTKWQAKYRRWYGFACNENRNKDLSPQSIQRQYPEYQELVSDLIAANNKLIAYKKVIEKIAFDK